ncbi:GntR family transcriptional regulator [Catenuloplanes nepalensis]|uniref:GntR family transcriptional regulator n=1 Tax=Catenuloplanes nepalensis TaxID=587533 RepID=A0ABT9N735_9ACTN|nr:GntR family transcriptional regulator [Catenuloplanes nepalensis]MDP9799507.1 GntR family transcriptional regulator [Catenuloplanes nepalensis]
MKRAEIRELLRELIDGREPGDMMPSERHLSERFGVSRPTLRAAIEDLTRDGLLVRSHGRGTFTPPRKISQELAPASAGNFTVPPAEGDWRSEVIDFRIEPAGARLGRRMERSPGESLRYIQRVRVVDGAPMAIERIRIPAELVPGLVPADVETGSLYQLLRMRYEVVVADAVQTTEPTVTDAEESRLLGVPLHAPALLFERTTRDTSGRVVEFARSIYRGDRYRITTHLAFGSDAG